MSAGWRQTGGAVLVRGSAWRADSAQPGGVAYDCGIMLLQPFFCVKNEGIIGGLLA